MSLRHRIMVWNMDRYWDEWLLRSTLNLSASRDSSIAAWFDPAFEALAKRAHESPRKTERRNRRIRRMNRS